MRVLTGGLDMGAACPVPMGSPSWVGQGSGPTHYLGEGGPDKQSQVAVQEEEAPGEEGKSLFY